MLPNTNATHCLIHELLPPYAMIDRSFKISGSPYREMLEGWIFGKYPVFKTLTLRSGIGLTFAISHLSRIIHARSLPHDDKLTYCSYLMNQWFHSNEKENKEVKETMGYGYDDSM